MMTAPLISAETALERLGKPGVIFLDASWTYPGGPSFKTDRVIPGAVRFDIARIADRTSGLPHTLPEPDQFAELVGALGISNTSELIVYDRIGVFTAPRVWWMFQIMGHHRTYVLNGGMPAWLGAGGTSSDALRNMGQTSVFKTDFRPELLADWQRIDAARHDGMTRILDARSAGRFRGDGAEPRPGMRAGHIPGSASLPYSSLIDKGGRLDPAKLPDSLLETDDEHLVTSCGSGVTACILSLALYCRGRSSAVYDGSWSEWGQREDLPVETGDGSNL